MARRKQDPPVPPPPPPEKPAEREQPAPCDGSVSHCECSRHCKTNCPYLSIALIESGEIYASCDLFETSLVRDPFYLRFAMVLFARNRECRIRFDTPPARHECRAVN